MTKTPPVRVYRCGRCNKRFKTDEVRVHSVWTGLSYCWSLDACAARAKKFTTRPELTYLPSAIRD